MITFDAATHTYTDATGVRVPSVTQILKATGCIPDYSGIDPDVLAHAAARGSYVDSCANAYDAGTLVLDRVDARAKGYVEAWIAFRRESGYQPDASDGLVHCPTRHYAGTFDSIGRVKDAVWLIDRKCTSKVSRTYGVQLAGYASAQLDGVPLPPCKRVVVQLKPDGGYRVVPFEDEHDFRVWDAAVTVYHYQQGGK